MDNGYRKKVRGFGALILGGILGMAVSTLGKYPNLVHAGLVLLKSELFVGKIRRL